ncbi:MAG: hypothetical protein GY768_15645 [Planctomycetaceae bacterium]|nr:hypothetical protein [Planctomycetaceae bacterium]
MKLTGKIKTPIDDPTLVRVRLRGDVRCTMQQSNDEPYYQIEDLLKAKFYRLGTREWGFVKLLDGKQLLRDTIAQQSSFTAREAIMLVRWLTQNQLVEIEASVRHPVYQVEKKETNRFLNSFNPVFLRIPLFNPDALLERCLPWCAWTLTPIAFVLWLAVGFLALAQVLTQWDRFRSSLTTILIPENWLWLLIVWMVLKAAHEFYHGLICKKYGGSVPRCGLVLILFSPIAFVDVTSSWRFRSKWQRIFTAAGGMYIELFVASIAVLIWAQAESQLMAQLCRNVIVMASVSTLLCNANCLMRFDGYYMLADLLGIQNLYSKGQQYLSYFGRRYVLGIDVENPLLRATHGMLIRVYAFAALIWRWVFYAGILLTASVMFRGAGIAIAVLAAIFWLAVPAVKMSRYLVEGAGAEKPSLVRLGLVAGLMIMLVGFVLALPWPGGVSAPGIVDYDTLTMHRVDTPGFVREIHVSPGEAVETGQLLVTLENSESDLQLAEIELEIEESRIRSRVLRGDRDVVNHQVEKRKLVSLQEQKDELEQRVRKLMIFAAHGGDVIGHDLKSLLGQYMPTGAALVAVGNENEKRVRLSVSQKNVDVFLRQLDAHPSIRIKGRAKVITNGVLTRVDPRATRRLSSAGLAAPNGGPLAVAIQHLPQQADEDESFQLIEPHFLATVDLPSSEAASLRAGELANARMPTVGNSVGRHLYAVVSRWIRLRLRAKG